MKKNVVVFAGGGSGGHLYPGIAVARELQRQLPDVDIHFVGSKQGLENKIIPKEGFPLHTLPVGGLLRAGRANQIKTLILMPFVFIQCALLCLKLRPKLVLGVGGFAAGPFVLVASFFVKRTYIWEPNAHPGFTNRILSYFVKKAFVVFDVARKKLKSSKIISVGLPIRNTIAYRAREKSNVFRIFVFGGSQGARGINNAVSEAVLKGGSWLNNVEIVHQTGALDFEKLSKLYHNNSQVKAFAFIDDMPKYYTWADLVICRGGVGTISEVIACRKASLIIPLPTAAENHQQANAEYLVNAGAGEMLLQKDLTPDSLIQSILSFKNNPKKIENLESALAKLQRPSGAEAIVCEMLKDLNS